MRDYAGIAGNTGAFPQVIANDDSLPGANDGTALVAQWVRDTLAIFQATLNGASLAPDGNAETCGAAAGNLVGSQFIEALQLITGYPGEIFAFPAPMAGLVLPAGMRALKLEGQTIALADYPRLTDAVYCSDTANPWAPAFWRASNNPATVRDIAGAYMLLPDLRGQFLRGLDLTGAVDPGGMSRVAGDIQAESIKEHDHDKLLAAGSEYLVNGWSVSAGPTGSPSPTGGGASFVTGATGAGIGAGTANETRPTNLALTWCIRY